MFSIKTIIMAAGEGKRMNSKIPKVLQTIFQKPLLYYVIQAAKEIESNEICLILGRQAKEVEDFFASEKFSIVHQEQALGTGHALICAKDEIPNSHVLILSGDTPLIRAESLKKLIEQHEKCDNAVSLLSCHSDENNSYGKIVRDANGTFLKIVEAKDCNEQQKQITEINGGVYIFKGSILKKALLSLNNRNAQKEYYLTDTIEIIMKNGHKIEALPIADIDELKGVNTKKELAEASSMMQKRKNTSLMENGVVFVDPSHSYISPFVRIGKDTIIYPNVYIEGDSVIGEDNVIYPGSFLSDVIVGNGNVIRSSQISTSKIGNDNTIGPFANIRPESTIGNKCRIGNFVEIKKSIVEDESKISHFNYIGDANIGKNVNFGCGSITVNYDGLNKHPTKVKDGAFIGCNSNLIAPVTIEEEAYVAAGTTVTKNVPKGALAIGRVRQENKEHFVQKNKKTKDETKGR